MKVATPEQFEQAKSKMNQHLREILENDVKQKPKRQVYRTPIKDCDLCFCVHYSEKRRRCGLSRCFYDGKEDDIVVKNVIGIRKRGAEQWADM